MDEYVMDTQENPDAADFLHAAHKFNKGQKDAANRGAWMAAQLDANPFGKTPQYEYGRTRTPDDRGRPRPPAVGAAMRPDHGKVTDALGNSQWLIDTAKYKKGQKVSVRDDDAVRKSQGRQGHKGAATIFKRFETQNRSGITPIKGLTPEGLR